MTGCSDGEVYFHDLTQPVAATMNDGVPVIDPVFKFSPHTDCVNSVRYEHCPYF